jgi:glycosyltransferase involved in cell wall biosynthesis
MAKREPAIESAGSPPSPGVSVCFPAYNEEATIESVIRQASDLLSQSGLDYELLVCNDGSSDRTGEILRRLAADIEMKLLEHESNQGIRVTFEHLYQAASKELVFLNSTDRQWETAVLFELLPLTSSWDIVIASRRKKQYGLSRSFVSWTFNILPRLLFRVRTYDAGAVKLVRREVIARFPLVSRSPFSEAERLIRASRAGYRITEHPVDTNPRSAGKARGVSFRQVSLAVGDVFRVWRSLRKGTDSRGI